MNLESEITKAADEIVAAFARHDVAAYFGAFTPGATFIFHNYGRVLRSRAEYEELWREWESSGFRVLSCTSSEPLIQILTDDVAIFSHTVRTTMGAGGTTSHSGERETIVFQRFDDRWLAVHEHLSIDISFLD